MKLLRYKLLRTVLYGAGLALLMQSLTPPGTMPDDLTNGWLAKLCPDAIPLLATDIAADALHSEHAHHHHAQASTGDHADHEAKGDCELGSGLHQAAIASDTLLAVSGPAHRIVEPAPTRAVFYSTRPATHRNRSPPTA